MQEETGFSPNDPAHMDIVQLRARLVKLEADNQGLAAKNSKLAAAKAIAEQKAALLHRQVVELFHKLFRPKSERLDERQLELALEALHDLGIPIPQLEQVEEEVAPARTRKRGKPSGGRRPLLTNLVRERVEQLLAEEANLPLRP